MKMKPEEKKRLAFLIAVAVAVLSIGFAYYFAVKTLGGGLPCPIYTATGIYCPGCGITRMFMSLFSGNIVSALKYNAMVMILMPFVVFYGVRWSCEFVKNGRLGRMKKADLIAVWIVVALIVIFCILRNTAAFSFLAPVL